MNKMFVCNNNELLSARHMVIVAKLLSPFEDTYFCDFIRSTLIMAISVRGQLVWEEISVCDTICNFDKELVYVTMLVNLTKN